jgi:hypothetical protein
MTKSGGNGGFLSSRFGIARHSAAPKAFAEAEGRHSFVIRYSSFSHTLRRLRGFHVLCVFAEARFAIAPGAVMERLLRFGHVRLFAFPCFKHRGL